MKIILQTVFFLIFTSPAVFQRLPGNEEICTFSVRSSESVNIRWFVLGKDNPERLYGYEFNTEPPYNNWKSFSSVLLSNDTMFIKNGTHIIKEWSGVSTERIYVRIQEQSYHPNELQCNVFINSTTKQLRCSISCSHKSQQSGSNAVVGASWLTKFVLLHLIYYVVL